MQRAIIQLKNIKKSYKSGDLTTEILHGISFDVKEGDFIAITGPSGSGKSTLLNIVGLLDVPTSGTYIVNGNDVTNLTEDEQAYRRNKEIGFVFQSFNLLQRTTALENVMLPAIYAGMASSLRTARAKELLTKVGLADHINKKPNQLSGGQQQRVAIARALMNDPAILLADEPTGNLDSKSGREVMHILKDLNHHGKTIVMITHSPELADEAKRVVTIRDGSLA